MGVSGVNFPNKTKAVKHDIHFSRPGAGKDPREDGIQWLPSTLVMALRLLRTLAPSEALETILKLIQIHGSWKYNGNIMGMIPYWEFHDG